MDSDALRIRREARRRAVRRRRGLAAGLLIALVAALAAVLIATSGGGGRSGRGSQAAGLTTSADLAANGSGAGRTHSSSASAGARAASGRPGTESVPILMYHVIAAPPPGAPFPGLYVEPGEFAAQLQALKSAGWHAITLDELKAAWTTGASLGPGKPIVLSFDNGYQSQYTQALPVLRRLGWVGDENLQLAGLPPSQGGLGEAEIRGLVAAGWELDTQGYSHADLITLDPPDLHYQVADARTALQRRYHVPVNWFCYPSGHYDATVIEAVKAAGYAGSTTVVPGWAHPGDDRYRLHRLRVLGGTTPTELLDLIASARTNPPAPSSYSGG
jgi:peptidoglycan/xylan/chitin deacetylase (PgdA/CDA1 family)